MNNQTMHKVMVEGVGEVDGVGSGEILLAALLKRRIHFAYSCQAGNCGACKCKLIEGEVDTLPYSDGVLSVAERAAGLILACRVRPRSNLVIRRVMPAQAVDS